MTKTLTDSSYEQIAEIDAALQADLFGNRHTEIEHLRDQFQKATEHYEALCASHSDASDFDKYWAMHEMWELSDHLGYQINEFEI